MDINITKENGNLNVVLVGRLDTVTSAELTNKLNECGYNDVDITLDFTSLEYISSAGLRLILQLQKTTKAQGKTLTIKNVNNVVKEIFRVTGFGKSLNII